MNKKGFPGGSDGKKSACNAGDLGLVPEWGRSLEKGMDTHSIILAWIIPWAEEQNRKGVIPPVSRLSGCTHLYCTLGEILVIFFSM